MTFGGCEDWDTFKALPRSVFDISAAAGERESSVVVNHDE